MIRHHVLMVLNDDAKDMAQPIVDALLEWAPSCAQIQKYSVGVDIGITPGAPDVAVVGEFGSVDDYKAYATNEGHVKIIQELILPNVASLQRCQTEF
ncbi:MAG: Dabb family protein [Acidimicrobiales bacterium]|jgi:hypothetical protein|nr:Dabb family protein [Acidimicrobiales bacterium]MDG2217596.1 Dabb family protein [Acidimicrobiales bacterium]